MFRPNECAVYLRNSGYAATSMEATQERKNKPLALGRHNLNLISNYARSWRTGRLMAGVDHQGTLDRVMDESGFDARYALMIVVSAGISILGLLLPSTAVLIGAMLISPLMMPIMGLGFGLATFDLVAIRRAAIALGLGSLIAILLSAAFVALSPLQAITTEIAIRTKPNLFDLLVAMLSALMGGYALIRGHGGAVVGVAIAIALMPPLSVVGFGIATGNATVFTGSLFLFLTNLVTMALTAAIVARLYGFGAQLLPKQTRLQAVIILVGLATFAVPLAFALKQIAWESVAQRQIRDAVVGQFPSAARIAQMDIDFQAEPIDIYAAVLTPSPVDDVEEAISEHLGRSLRQPFTLYVSQIDVGGDRRASEAAQIAAAQASEQRIVQERAIDGLVRMLALAAGVDRNSIVIDRVARRAVVSAEPLAGATFATYRELEQRAAATMTDWEIRLSPPVLALSEITFDGEEPDEAGSEALATAIWAGQRLRLPITVSGPRAAVDYVISALETAGLTAEEGPVRQGPVTMEWARLG